MSLNEAIRVARGVLRGNYADPIAKDDAYKVLSELHSVVENLKDLIRSGV